MACHGPGGTSSKTLYYFSGSAGRIFTGGKNPCHGYSKAQYYKQIGRRGQELLPSHLLNSRAKPINIITTGRCQKH